MQLGSIENGGLKERNEELENKIIKLEAEKKQLYSRISALQEKLADYERRLPEVH